MPQGTIRKVISEKGFGFIDSPESGGDVFVHYSGIKSDGFKTLAEGDEVEFELMQGPKGPKAENVVKVQ